MLALFPVPFGQGSASFFTHPSNYIRRLVQLLDPHARPKRLFARSSPPLVLGPVPADYPLFPLVDGFLHDNVTAEFSSEMNN